MNDKLEFQYQTSYKDKITSETTTTKIKQKQEITAITAIMQQYLIQLPP